MRIGIVLVGALLGLGIGCGKKEPKPPAATPPVAAADLKLDFGAAPEVPLPERSGAALLGLTLQEFQSKWATEAPKTNLPPSPAWTDQRIAIMQSSVWSAELGPDLELVVGTLGDSQLQEVRVEAKRAATTDAPKLLAAWNTVLSVLGHHQGDQDHRRVLEGLGLTAVPTAKAKRFSDAGLDFQLKQFPEGPTLTFTVTATRKPMAGTTVPYSAEIPMGIAPGAGKVTSFSAVWDPSTAGKSFQDGIQVCRARGLYPCTEPQWARVCATDSTIAQVQTWTTSFADGGKAPLAFGGQPGCGGGEPVASSELAPNRGTLCCSRAMALAESSESARLYTLPILMFEQGVDLKDGQLLSSAIGPEVVKFYTVTSATKEQVVKMSLDYARNEKGFWTIHESCTTRTDEDGYSFLRCRRSTFFAGKAMVTEADYGFSKGGPTLAWITDPIIRRGKAVY